MLISEMIRVSLFVGVVLSVLGLAAWMLIHLVLERLGSRPPLGRAGERVRRATFGLAGSGLLCIAYGVLIEPNWLEVTHVRLETLRLPPGARPVRLVHISDLHCDPAPRLETRLPTVIAAERPDIIVFTGDSLNSSRGLPVLKACLSELSRLAPTFAVKGNWDTRSFRDLDIFGGTGVRELDGEAVMVDVGGTRVWLAGAAFDNPSGVGRALGAVPPGALSVFLHHHPDEVLEVAAREVDLYLAGHTHGGQVALPFYGALVTFSKFGKRFESGLHRVGHTCVYVNRGIGMQGGAPRARFCARPEVTVIDLVPQSGG